MEKLKKALESEEIDDAALHEDKIPFYCERVILYALHNMRHGDSLLIAIIRLVGANSFMCHEAQKAIKYFDHSSYNHCVYETGIYDIPAAQRHEVGISLLERFLSRKHES